MIFKLLLYFGAPPSGCAINFFGLVPWYHYLPSTDFNSASVKQGYYSNTLAKCDINNNFNILHGNSIALILIAIVDDLLRVAGLVAVGFVMYGAIQFITSQGNPDEAAKARNTIINALIGLAICIIAIAFVGFIGGSLT